MEGLSLWRETGGESPEFGGELGTPLLRRNMLHHLPVMKEEVVRSLALKPGQVVVDATLGLGGHAAALLAQVGEGGELIGIERTEEGLHAAKENLGHAVTQAQLVQADFRSLEAVVRKAGHITVDAVFFDLGLASWQIDTGYQGVSFQQDAVLDLRLSPLTPDTFTTQDEDPLQWTGDATLARLVRMWRFRPARDFLADETEAHIEAVLSALGGVRQAKRIAAAIANKRKTHPIETTLDLRQACESDAPGLLAPVFQALRILTNDEYGALVAGLRGAWRVLKNGGRLVVITFQGGEDHITKRELRAFSPVSLKRFRPTQEEVLQNTRARSAILRLAIKAN